MLGWEHLRAHIHVKIGDMYEFSAWLTGDDEFTPLPEDFAREWIAAMS